MTIYLIRHAQTVHNKKGKVFSGVSDVLLSDEGKKDAEKCRELEFLKSTEKIYISPLKRTRQTADIIFGEETGKEIIPAFEEMNFGKYEGKILDEASETDEVFKLWMSDPENLTFPGGDNFKKHAAEAFSAFKEIAQSGGNDVISIVSHRTTIRLILTLLLSKPLNTFREIPCDNCSVAEIVFENDEFKVKRLNIRA